DRRAVELHHAVALELGQQVLRLGPRQEHGVAEMAPGARAAEDCAEEEALIDLEPAPVALDHAVLGGDFLRGRKKPRHHAGSADDQILDPDEARASHGERVVDRIGVAMQEPYARLARTLGDEVRRAVLALAAPRLRRETANQTR